MNTAYRLIINGRLPGLNELITAERTHRQKGAKLKRDAETLVRWHIRQQLRGVKPKTPVHIEYRYFEPDRRRDCDNIAAFAHKVIQDALVKERVLPNDGWAQINGFSDYFAVDAKKPRIEITIIEAD